MDSRQARDDRFATERTYSFGYLLRRLRKACDLTQEELASRAGCTANTIHKIESDARRPSQILAERLSDALALKGDERSSFIRSARATLSPDHLAFHTRPEQMKSDTIVALAVRHNLPAQTTAFVGRERELDALARLIATPGIHVITVCGLGGMGKTRLALAAAEQQLTLSTTGTANFSDGIFFVALAGLDTRAQLVAAIAAALELPRDLGPQSVHRQLIDYLRHRRLLLILDNYEHLLEHTDLIDEIIEAAPEVKLIVTSRERLKLHGEYLLMLEGLAVPPDGIVVTSPHYDAVQLFLQAARQAQADIVPGDQMLRAVVAICRLVEGMPLAIEMAASWLALLSPTDIAAELEQNIDLLTTEWRDIPLRQHSVRAVCSASWQRLAPDVQAVFERLSTFRGGFTLDAARIVAGATLPRLASLSNQVLIRYDPARERYSIHELLRKYAAEQLSRDPARQATALQAHAGYFSSLLVREAAKLHCADQLAAVAAIGAEDENLHAAWYYAIRAGLIELIDLAADSLGAYYEWQGYWHEGLEPFRIAAEADCVCGDDPQQQNLRARLLAWYGAFCLMVGSHQEAAASIEQSLAILQSEALSGCEPEVTQAFVLWRMGQLRVAQGSNEAQVFFGQSLALYRKLGRTWETSAVLKDLGNDLWSHGRSDEAITSLGESVAICEQCSDIRGQIEPLELLSQAYFECDRLGEAERLARRSVELSHPLGSRSSAAAALGRLGMILLHTGRYVEAVNHLAQSLEHYTGLGDEPTIAWAHGRLALSLMHQGELGSALRNAEIAVEIARRHGGTLLVETLLKLALVQDSREDYTAADTTVTEGVALAQHYGLARWVGQYRAEEVSTAWALGDRRRARDCAVEALRLAIEQHNLTTLMMVTPNCIPLLIEQGQGLRAAEIYGIDSESPLWQDSAGVSAYRASLLRSISAALPPEEVSAALERGRQLDRWETARELLHELTSANAKES